MRHRTETLAKLRKDNVCTSRYPLANSVQKNTFDDSRLLRINQAKTCTCPAECKLEFNLSVTSVNEY